MYSFITIGGGLIAKKILEFDGSPDLILQTARQACEDEKFKVQSDIYSNILKIKKQGYTGNIKINDDDLEINLSAPGGLKAMVVLLCFFIFLFGLQLTYAWYVLSKKPNNMINKIIRKINNDFPENSRPSRDRMRDYQEQYQSVTRLAVQTTNQSPSGAQSRRVNCPYCGINLEQHATETFCPNCGRLVNFY